jgi:hypothetical protein
MLHAPRTDFIWSDDGVNSNHLSVDHGLRPCGQTSGPNTSGVCRDGSHRHSETCE